MGVQAGNLIGLLAISKIDRIQNTHVRELYEGEEVGG